MQYIYAHVHTFNPSPFAYTHAQAGLHTHTHTHAAAAGRRDGAAKALRDAREHERHRGGLHAGAGPVNLQGHVHIQFRVDIQAIVNVTFIYII